VTAFITFELRNSIRFLERIYCHDELRLHQMPLGERIEQLEDVGRCWKMLESHDSLQYLAASRDRESCGADAEDQQVEELVHTAACRSWVGSTVRYC
jgi:hypothetical protein